MEILKDQEFWHLLSLQVRWGLFGGQIAERINGSTILCVSLVTAAPILYLALNSNNLLFIVFLLFGNFILSSSVPANIVMGQQMLPNNQNLATSFMMGTAWRVVVILLVCWPTTLTGNISYEPLLFCHL